MECISRFRTWFRREPSGAEFTKNERVLRGMTFGFVCLGAVCFILSLALSLPPRIVGASLVLVALGFGEYFFIQAGALERKLKTLQGK